MKMLSVPIFSLIFATSFNFVSPLAHDLKWGSCPTVEAKDNFDYKQILGLWYVIERTQTSSTCMTYNFLQYDSGELKVREVAKPMGVSIPYILEKFTQTGKLRVPDSKKPAQMKLTFTFTLVPFTEFSFTVMDTDYTSYLATFSCRKLIGFHSQAAMILSREPNLDPAKIKELRDKFERHSINTRRFSKVDQKHCQHNVTLNSTELEPEKTERPTTILVRTTPRSTVEESISTSAAPTVTVTTTTTTTTTAATTTTATKPQTTTTKPQTTTTKPQTTTTKPQTTTTEEITRDDDDEDNNEISDG